MLNSQFQGYLAVPESGKGPGVLVLHPWWGLNDTMKEVCNRLAGEGFIACAPDLYHGQVAVTIEEAEVLSGKLNPEQAKADITEAVKLLWEHARPGGQALGVIGFSLGAYFALGLSENDSERIRAVVLFYGTGPREAHRSKAAYLGHFAASDDFEPATEVEGLETALRASNHPVTFYRYEGVGHWFFEPDRPDAYNPSAAQLAWERTVSFLISTLA
jgi:carboxymethylenebutenolidase